jgi:hypothetical protein
MQKNVEIYNQKEKPEKLRDGALEALKQLEQTLGS